MNTITPPLPWKGFFFVAIPELLDRFSYYGMRSIVLLFLVGPLGVANTDALSYYVMFTTGLYLTCLPAGILTDLVLKQKKAVLIGGFIAVLGYVLMAMETLDSVFAGMICVIIGVSLSKPNRTVLVGRLFNKTDGRRDGFFLFYYAFINIGALAASLALATLAQQNSWAEGFLLCAVAMLLGQGIFAIGMKYIPEVEVQEETKLPEATFNWRWLAIGITIFAAVLYWAMFEMQSSVMTGYLYEIEPSMLPFPAAALQGVSIQLSILLSLLVGLYWAIRGSGSSFMRMGFALCLIALASAGPYLFLEDTGMASITFVGLFLATSIPQAISEVLISPVALSYLTRLSPTAASSSVMGGYFLMTGLGNRLMSILEDSELFVSNASNFLALAGTVSLVIGIALVVSHRFWGEKIALGE